MMLFVRYLFISVAANFVFQSFPYVSGNARHCLLSTSGTSGNLKAYAARMKGMGPLLRVWKLVVLRAICTSILAI